MRDFGGGTIILTRAVPDNADLARDLRAAGAKVIEFPCIAIEPVDDGRALASSLRSLTRDDCLVVTSRAGARAVAQVLGGDRLEAPVAVVGPATELVARELGLEVSFRPSRPDGACLGAELRLPRGTVLLARSDRAAGEIVSVLRDRGARVHEVVAYRTAIRGTAGAPEPVRTACARGAVALLASPSAVDGFTRAVGRELAARCRLVAIGSTTAQHVQRRLGREPFVAERPALPAIVAAISQAQRSEVPA
jgi:uroporphyrinogen III methyltransferase / synthase